VYFIVHAAYVRIKLIMIMIGADSRSQNKYTKERITKPNISHTLIFNMLAANMC